MNRRSRKFIGWSVYATQSLWETPDRVEDHPGSLRTIYKLSNVRVWTISLTLASGSKYDSND